MIAIEHPTRKRTPFRTLFACLLTVLIGACSTVQPPLRDAPSSPSAQIAACGKWFIQFDDRIETAGVRDAATYHVPGFPYMRVDRFAASFGETAQSDEKAFKAWTDRLMTLDAQARAYELSNLPPQTFPLGDVRDKAAAQKQTQDCAQVLSADDLQSAERRRLLVERARVPDNYSDLSRAVGLYPLTRIPFSWGVEKWHAEAGRMFAQSRERANIADGAAGYGPAAAPVDAQRIRSLFAGLRADALGVPQIDAKDLAILFATYAPRYEIETAGEYDRFGPLQWNGGPSPAVDTAKPVVYTRLAYTRLQQRTLMQLLYTIWFPERPSNGAFDLLAGRLDGVVFRVTLDADGTPLVYDTIHPCGCYHMFFPTADAKPLPAPDGDVEWAFVPLTLPALSPAQSVTIRIASRTHYVIDVRPAAARDGGTPYAFAPEEDLRAIRQADEQTRSAFGPDGIVPGTARGERYLFWPMGIDNSGAMREWGTHATAFIGRRHFDDADLIERRFQFSTRRADGD